MLWLIVGTVIAVKGSGMKSGVYAIEDRATGKVYIGSAVRLNARKSQHMHMLRSNQHHSAKLQNAYNKRGEGAFAFRILLICRKEDLLFYEQRAIDAYCAVESGYNILPVAGSSLGVKHSEKTRAKLRLAHQNPERKASMRAVMRGKPGSRLGAKNTKEANKKISAAAKAQWSNSEHRASMSRKAKEQMSSLENREKIGRANRGRKQSPETVENNRKAQTGKVLSLEHRTRISAGLLKHYREAA